MSYYNTTATYNTTGIKTISPGFTPAGMRITVSAKNGGGDSLGHISIGQVDTSGWATFHTVFQDTTGGSTKRGAATNGQLVSCLERVSGTITQTGAASFDSFTATAGKFNVTDVTSTWQYNIELWD